jgi:hypothetical protein
MEDGTPFSNQLVYMKHNEKHRYLNYSRARDDSTKTTVENLASHIKYLTGDWFTKMTCSEIQAEDRTYFDEFIFLGDEQDIFEGDLAHLLN